MTFPNSFYKTKPQLRLKHTAICTGVLETPLDLANKRDRPWITIEEGAAEVAAEKRALIFADHFFQSRDSYDRLRIMQALRKAKQEGFPVLIQWPEGELKEWDGHDLPDDYKLSLDTYTNETINQLAWTQQQLAAGNIFILNYWGINELTGQIRYKLNEELLKQQSEDFLKLISTAPEHSLELCFVSGDEEDQASTFFQLLSERQAHPLLTKFRSFDLKAEEASEETQIDFLRAVPWLEDLSLFGLENGDSVEYFKLLLKLATIWLEDCSLTEKDVAALFNLSVVNQT